MGGGGADREKVDAFRSLIVSYRSVANGEEAVLHRTFPLLPHLPQSGGEKHSRHFTERPPPPPPLGHMVLAGFLIGSPI